MTEPERRLDVDAALREIEEERAGFLRDPVGQSVLRTADLLAEELRRHLADSAAAEEVGRGLTVAVCSLQHLVEPDSVTGAPAVDPAIVLAIAALAGASLTRPPEGNDTPAGPVSSP